MHTHPAHVVAVAALALGPGLTSATADARPPSGEAHLGGLPVGAVGTEGPVQLARHGDTIVVRGTGLAGPLTGNGVLLDPTTGTAAGTASAIKGEVRLAEPDGAGGWYVAGAFTHVGDQARLGVAHLDAAGRVDPAFAVAAFDVTALALDGDTLYLGGGFNFLDGTYRDGLGAVDATTGAVLPFDPPSYLDTAITAIQPVPAAPGRSARVVVASISSYDERAGAHRDDVPTDNDVRALDPVTGDDVPGFLSDDASVHALALAGTHLYAGGERGLADLDLVTGAADPAFDPVIDELGRVTSLAVGGGRVYAGGSFTTLGGAHGPLVAIDPATGVADPDFDPPLQPREGVLDVSLSDGDLWVGGSRTLAGAGRGSVRRLDPATGAVRPGTLPTFTHRVDVVQVSGGTPFVGGLFWTVGETTAPDGLVTLDADTLEVVATGQAHPDAAGDLLVSATALYVAPTHFRRPPRDRDVVALEPRTGRLLGRLTHRDVPGLTGVAVTATRLYVVQRTGPAKRLTNRVTVYDAATGARLRAFRVPVRGRVHQLVATARTLYFAGTFHGRRFDSQVLATSLTGRLRRGLQTDLAPTVTGKGGAHATDLAVGTGTSAGRLLVTVERSGGDAGSLVAVRASDGRRIGAFRTARPWYCAADCTATVTGDQVVVTPASPSDIDFGALIYDARTGAPVPDGAGGFAGNLYDVLPTPQGDVRAGWVDLGVPRSGGYDVETFVTRAQP